MIKQPQINGFWSIDVSLVKSELFMLKQQLTGVSAVGLVGAFALNLPVQGLGCWFWRDRSDPAAHAKHYKKT